MSARPTFALTLVFLASAGCAHTASSLGDLSAPRVGCTEDEVSVLDVVSRDGGHTFRAYCRGRSFDCRERDDVVTCEDEGRILATDAERSRVSTTDHAVQVTGEGSALLLTQGIDAGRSRLTLYAYPRTLDEHVSVVIDSRNRSEPREGCSCSLVADEHAEGLEPLGYERTAYGERISVRGTLRIFRLIATARRALLRICDEELLIEEVDRRAVGTYVERFDTEAAAAARSSTP